jgi:DNA-binding MarR family transcriptional regulator
MATSTKTARSAAPGTVALDGTVTYRLHTLGKLTDRVSQAAYVEGAGIGHAEGRCLAAIGAFTPVSVNELAFRANLDKGQASRAAQSLVEQGLVRKQPSPADGRGVVLTLSPKGERIWQRVMGVIERRNREIVACLDARERQQLDRLLDRLIAAARAVAEAPQSPTNGVEALPPQN